MTNYVFMYVHTIEMSFIWKDDFFCQNQHLLLRSQAHLAKRSSSVYTTIFVRRKDKLIICKIRHELSVTIHELSSSWQKKTLDGGLYNKCKSYCFVLFRKSKAVWPVVCSNESALRPHPGGLMLNTSVKRPYIEI